MNSLKISGSRPNSNFFYSISNSTENVNTKDVDEFNPDLTREMMEDAIENGFIAISTRKWADIFLLLICNKVSVVNFTTSYLINYSF